MDHAAYLDHFPQQRGGVDFGYYLDIAGYYEVVLELAGGIDRDPQEPGEFLFAFLASTLNNVRRDRHRGSNDLAPERDIVGPANPHRNSVRVQRKRVRLLPNQQIPEVAHTKGCRESCLAPPSLSRRPNPPFPAPVEKSSQLRPAAKLTAPCFGILVGSRANKTPKCRFQTLSPPMRS